MIYFVRHGETDYNLQGITQGQLDIPLNDTGIQQAHIVKDKLQDVPFDIIYSSPLSRAKVTAEIINDYHNLEVLYDDRLMEFFAGKRQGQKFQEWSSESRAEFLSEPEKYGAESHIDFYNRVVEFYEEIKDTYEHILIVSHGGVYRNIYRHLRGITDFNLKFYTPQNCDVICIDNDKIWIMGSQEEL